MKRWRIDMFGRRALIVALVLLAGGIVAKAGSERPAVHTLAPAGLAKVSDYIRNEVATAKIPGAILLLQQHGKPVYYANFGVRDVATEISMSADTIFRLYSMSKPITSVMAMMLVEEGKLSLDDPVAKYIPAFANMKVDVEKKAEDDKVALVLEPLDRPVTIEDRDIRRPLKWESGGGGMVGTVGDYARFAQNAAEWRQL